MLNIVLFGPPGAGKGTQSIKLVEKFNLVHLSTGDVFRYNIKNETPLGQLAKSYMDKGNLVPDEVTINMLKAEVEKQPDAKGFIFDGFPRTTAQAEALDAFLAEKGTAVSMMLALQVDEDELVKRLLLRGKDSGRADDTDESIIGGTGRATGSVEYLFPFPGLAKDRSLRLAAFVDAGKVFGTSDWVTDVHVPGMLHGRVVRPPYAGVDVGDFIGNSLIADSMADLLSTLLRIPTQNKPLTIVDVSGMPSER